MSPGSSTGRVVAGRYRIVAPIGSGGHGVVDLAEDLLNGGRRVALKRLEGIVGAGDPEPAADHLRWFRHPRWAEILDEGRLDAHGRFQVVRYVDGKSLDHLELPRPVDEILTFLEDGARVLGALHARGLIHYDVTPGNVLREERPDGGVTFTLTDGGLANLGPVRGIARGTVMYMAPEIADGAPHDHRVDLYALGLVAFRLATGRDPWTGGAGEVLGGRRREAAPPVRAYRPDVDPRLEHVIACLLERDPNRRVADSQALLALLVEAGRASAGGSLEGEYYAEAAGGFVLGRDAEITRFRAACRTLLAGPTPTPIPTDDAPASMAAPATLALHDNVLIVHGPAGSGGTRLVEEYVAIARAEGVPVLALSGRDGAADRRGPLRRLADGIALLTGHTDVLAATGRADARPGRDDAGTGDDVRMTERFVALCDRTAEKTPLVLVVADFEEFPVPAQEAVRVLARHLLSRSEHPDGRAPARILLVVDHGASEPDGFLLPDATDPRRPVQFLEPLTSEAIRALVAERFQGIDPVPEDIETVRAVTEGLPRLVISVLAQARERGDLRRENGLWIWNASPTASYALDRRISPAAARALAALSPEALQVAQYLAILEIPVPEEFLRRLASPTAIADFAASPLASVSMEALQARYALRSRTLNSRLLDSQTPSRVASLLMTLSSAATTELQLEFHRLRATLGQRNRALIGISQDAGRLSTPQRRRALAIASSISSSQPAALKFTYVRRGLSILLVDGVESDALVSMLEAVELTRPNPDPETCLLLAEHRLRARDSSRARALAEAALSTLREPEGTRFALLRTEARVLILRSAALCSFPASAERLRALALAEARGLTKESRRKGDHLLAHLALASARSAAAASEHSKAISLSKRALRAARRARRFDLVAAAYNNIALSLAEMTDFPQCIASLKRSVWIRHSIGDVRGATVATQNLGRLLRRSGSLVAASAAHARAYGVAIRHGYSDVLMTALVSMSEIQDQLGAPSLAYRTLDRASRMPTSAASNGLRAIADVRRFALGWCIRPATAFLSRARLVPTSRIAPLSPTSRRLLRTLRAVDFGYSDPTGSAMLRAFEESEVPPGLELRLALRVLHRLCSAPMPPGRGYVRTTLRSPYQQFLAEAMRLRRHCDPAAALSLCESISGMATSSHGPGGPHQRLAFVMLLGVVADHADALPELHSILLRLARVAEQRGWALLSSRAFAALAAAHLKRGDATAAGRSISSALVGFSAQTPPEVTSIGSRVPSPREFVAFAALAGAAADRLRHRNRSFDLFEHLHAFAHRSLLGASAVSPDARRENALRAMLSFAARTQASPSLEPLLDSLNSFAREITGAERTCIVLVDDDAKSEARIASSATGPHSDDRPSVISHTILRRVLRERRPLLLHDIYGDSDLVQRPSVVAMSLRSVLCVPLVRGASLYGAMYADNSVGAGSFDQTDLDVLTLFADQAAAAIASSRLLGDVQRSLADLRSAQEKLLKGERLRVMGEMTSGVAHEFNNLLTAILARIQLMGLGELPIDIREQLSLVEKAALDAAEVVRRLQGFTRQQRQGSHQIVDVAEVCTDVVELLRPLWASRRRHGRTPVVVRLVAARGLLVRGEATELREVLTNLVKNSLEALETGGSITVGAERIGDFARVSVQDDGCGIPDELLQRLFTPFFTTKGDRGTGLGLCLCQQIVERHGSNLTISSRVGEGTRAEFRLPIASPERLDRPKEVPLGALARPRILVVDDDPDVLSPLCDYLKRSGFDVTGLPGGVEALIELQRVIPDLILTDVAMPITDGIEVCRRARVLRPGVPVVLMSGQASGIDPAVVREVGATALLAKPFTMRQILDLITDVTSRARTELSPAPT